MEAKNKLLLSTSEWFHPDGLVVGEPGILSDGVGGGPDEGPVLPAGPEVWHPSGGGGLGGGVLQPAVPVAHNCPNKPGSGGRTGESLYCAFLYLCIPLKSFFLQYRSIYPVQAPVIDVILAPVLLVDGSVVEAVNHAVDSQHVRLVRRHCSLRLYDHRRAPWHKSQSISMLDELRQKCGNEQNGKRRMWLLQVVWWGGLLTDSGEKLVEPSPETRLVRAYLNS